ncbi:hypothetical protein [Dactylosporangium sp. NPDC048998]|uniref:hypothetical protein n=1 Tax=Dactylosporangium sp. NPDC048998 TaxID=3363976 RepID=UPI0037124BDA
MTILAGHSSPPLVRLRAHGRLASPVDSDVLVTASVGPSGEAITLWADPAGRKALLTPGGLAESCARQPVSVRVVVQDASTTRVTTIAALDLPFCKLQPLPDGRTLVVATRGGRAIVFDADGTPVLQGDVGDGIEHALTTLTGQVWVGYFDEGVFGGGPFGPHSIVRFTADLEPDWRYPGEAGFGPIDDCYSLNVEGETAWACYHSSFPIVRMSDGMVSGWRNKIRGATALVAHADTCALFGGYRAERGRAVIGRLSESQNEPISEGLLVLPDDRPLPGGVRVIGRGPDLHVLAETEWYRVGLDDLP